MPSSPVCGSAWRLLLALHLGLIHAGFTLFQWKWEVKPPQSCGRCPVYTGLKVGETREETRLVADPPWAVPHPLQLPSQCLSAGELLLRVPGRGHSSVVCSDSRRTQLGWGLGRQECNGECGHHRLLPPRTSYSGPHERCIALERSAGRRVL